MRIPQIPAGELRRVLGGQQLENFTGDWSNPTWRYADPPAVASRVAKAIRHIPPPRPAAQTGGFFRRILREMFARD